MRVSHTSPTPPPADPQPRNSKTAQPKAPAAQKQPQQQQQKKPQEKSYASTAAAAPEKVEKWTTAGLLKKKKVPLFKPAFSKLNREIVVKTGTAILSTITDNAMLYQINERLEQQQQRALMAKKIGQQTIIITAPFEQDTNHLLMWEHEIRETLIKCRIDVNEIKANTKTAKFLLHGVPTNIGENLMEVGEYVAATFKFDYKQLTLPQIPYWLSREENRSEKAHSTMVIALNSNHTFESLGFRYIVINNKFCQIETYHQYGPATQCRNCCKLGHPTALCKEKMKFFKRKKGVRSYP